MKSLDIDAMSNAVKKVIALCGIDVLADEKRFQAAIRDFLYSSALATEQQLLIFSVRVGIGRELLYEGGDPEPGDPCAVRGCKHP